MKDTQKTSAIPPALPDRARTQLLHAAALSLAVISAGAVGRSFYVWREIARYHEGFPPGVISGGRAFSLNFPGWLNTFGALGLGSAAFCLLLISTYVSWLRGQRLFSFFHVAATVFLMPFFYLAYRFVSMFFR